MSFLTLLPTVPVGDSTPSLLSILREVHMLESASHPNIVAYHHAWLETASPTKSRFVPKVPTLHILMEFANGGSLQGFIDARKGSPTTADEEDVLEGHGAAHAARRRRKEARARAIHLLRLEDVLTLFEQVVRGLAFLHGRNILHLDLKVSALELERAKSALTFSMRAGRERAPPLGRRLAPADMQTVGLWIGFVRFLSPRTP